MADLTFTDQQETFFHTLTEMDNHIMLVARAGCGKTTALVEGAKRVAASKASPNLLAVCFNSSIQKELAERMPAFADTSTMHSLGFKLLKASRPDIRFKVDKNKFQARLRPMFDDWETRQQIATIIDKMRINLSYSHTAAAMFLEDIGAKATLADYVMESLEWGEQAIDEGLVDFTDMLWAPVRLKLRPSRTYKMVMVDEAQDLSHLQQILVKKHVHPMGRIVICGDPKQAIYGFAGAQASAMQELANRFTAKPTEVCKITETFRCPKAVVECAKREGQAQRKEGMPDDSTLWLDDFTALPVAPEGEVKRLSDTELTYDMLNHEDAVLSRTNRPLMEVAIWLISNGWGFRINGRDLFRSIKSRLCSGLKDTASTERALQKVEEWLIERKEWAAEIGRPQLANRHEDIAECCRVFLKLPGMQTVADIKTKINSIEEMRYGPMLSSIHKAKGLEWDRVFWLGHQDHIKKMAQLKEIDDPTSQEWNLRYVCATRAKQKLFLVNDIDFGGDSEDT